MNKKIGLYVVVANLLFILALTFLVPQSMVAPGKLIEAHRALETDCFACHSDHKGVQAFRPIGRFSHDLLQAGIGGRCNGCHRGPGDSLHRQIDGNCAQYHRQQAWTPATFDHDQLFLLDRDHQATCNTCHVGNDYSRYTCYGCHEHSRSDIREEPQEEGIYQYENCVECHRSGDAEDTETHPSIREQATILTKRDFLATHGCRRRGRP